MEKECVVGKEAKVEECSISECNLFRVVVATLCSLLYFPLFLRILGGTIAYLTRRAGLPVARRPVRREMNKPHYSSFVG